MKNPRLWAALFLLYWVAVFALDVFDWRKPYHRPDMVPAVLWLHFLLPVLAGALAAWWPKRLPAAMAAGAAVLILDAAALLAYQFLEFDFDDPGGNESIFELPVLLIALGMVGSLLGLAGAGAAHLVGVREGTALPREPVPIPPRVLRTAGALALAAATLVALAVLPAIPQAQGRNVTALAVNVALNLLIAAVLFAPVSMRGAARVPLMMTAFLALLLGSALLDLATRMAGSRGPQPETLACFAASAAGLAAGLLPLAAVFMRWRRRDLVPLPAEPPPPAPSAAPGRVR